MRKFTFIIFTILIMLFSAACKNETKAPALGSGSVYFTVYDITAPAEGQILGLILEKGDRIGKEQPLFAIDDKQLAEEIKQADANAARAEAELKIMKNGQSSPNNGAALAAAQQQYEQASAKEAKMASLYKIGAIARRQYEAASAEKSAALAALNAAQNGGSLVKASPEAIAQKQEELKTLKKKYNALMQKQLALETESPCTGIVEEKYHNAGETAAAGEKILSIRDLENCSVNIKISVQAAQSLKPGQKITAHAQGLNKTFNGSISKIENGLAEINIDNTSLDLKEGTEVTVSAVN